MISSLKSGYKIYPPPPKSESKGVMIKVPFDSDFGYVGVCVSCILIPPPPGPHIPLIGNTPSLGLTSVCM